MTRRIFVVAPTALLTDHRPHGDGLVAHGFLSELGARGHELHVATRRVDLEEELPANVHLHVVGGGPRGAASDRLRFMWEMRRLFRRLARTSPAFDLVHQLNPVDVGVSLALADVTVPVVLGPYVPDWAPSGAGADPGAAGAVGLKKLIRAAQQRRATTVLLSSPAAAAKIHRRPPGLHVRELSPGIDDRLWTPRDQDGVREGQDVLFLSNLERRKGIRVLLDAFDLVSDALPSARLIVAGSGPEGDAVRARVGSLRDPRRVELLGTVARDRAVDLMRGCDVFCLPSYGEPFGMTALEAMACGRALVATDAGGLGHLVTELGGRKVPPGDAAGLASALREVLADVPLRRAMGAHNRRLVEERYAWPRIVDRLEELYDEAVCEPDGRRRKRAFARRPSPTV